MNQESDNKKYVLVLGGSNFMGKSLVFRLSGDPNVKAFMINRGKKHW